MYLPVGGQDMIVYDWIVANLPWSLLVVYAAIGVVFSSAVYHHDSRMRAQGESTSWFHYEYESKKDLLTLAVVWPLLAVGFLIVSLVSLWRRLLDN